MDPDNQSVRARMLASEWRRVDERRTRLGIETGADRWALSFSGGGIRSATFSLGVLQALARHRLANAPGRSALKRFDYLSTVSGGGYIGSFFCSLFVPGRLRPIPSNIENADDIKNETEKERILALRRAHYLEVAQRAYEVLEYEPPGRIHSGEDYIKDPPGEGPLAWLRENGRYLTPTGAGDVIYASVLAIRNWLAVHYVIGSLALFALSAIALLRVLLSHAYQPFGDFEHSLLEATADGQNVWWSPLWALPLFPIVLWALPLCVAFWLPYPTPQGSTSDPPRAFTWASAVTLLIAAASAWIAAAYSRATTLADFWVSARHCDEPSVFLATLIAIVAGIGCLIHFAAPRRGTSISRRRVALTRRLARATQWTLGLAALGLMDTLGQVAYLWLARPMNRNAVLAPAAVFASLVWLVRKAAFVLDERAKLRIRIRVPIAVVATGMGAAMLAIVGVSWEIVVHWLQWSGDLPRSAFLDCGDRRLILIGSTVGALLLSITAGRFPGFINLSTLQSLYGARLTRAYLGASNRERLAKDGAQYRSAAEPAPGDPIKHEDYYNEEVLAPIHIINVTVNQTSDPAEQLTQRDRKGRALAILPTGYTIDDHGIEYANVVRRTELDRAPTIGEWIGISGAAVTTGLGRSTSLGFSLVLGLANVRLGTWWRSGLAQIATLVHENAVERVFRCQSLLFRELTGKFHGLRREYQYLSDGGHFENTAVYELLRRERAIKLIFACDNGCDPQYEFGDLANLVRLARIDHGLEIKIDPNAAKDEILGAVFGTPEELAQPAGSNGKCALLLNVYETRPTQDDNRPERSETLRCRIIVVKPRVTESLPLDVRNYAKTHSAFPEEPTADQFFDESQWEAYRKLGLELGNRVLTACEDGGLFGEPAFLRDSN